MSMALPARKEPEEVNRRLALSAGADLERFESLRP